jgi:hypothetical protein
MEMMNRDSLEDLSIMRSALSIAPDPSFPRKAASR